ncbi:UvrD-helicase domain-containing protein [Sulfitobacter geojensis]|uniref:UvrD-helicase domain-containing protein n=1 Tax=Sulfitobacter geojensis TaxID=1342299 RepID=UPI001911E114|nr:UvrD-helicase domain-containing protein [Sulfitobacter geojensis]
MTALTPQQRQAVDHNGNLLLTACPGSGKTRVIMAKLLLLAEQLEDTPRSIGCITYTNAAVEEIESRIKQNGSQSLLERCEIATIHAFCLRFVLKPYCWLIPELPNDFKILTREMRLAGQYSFGPLRITLLCGWTQRVGQQALVLKGELLARPMPRDIGS